MRPLTRTRLEPSGPPTVPSPLLHSASRKLETMRLMGLIRPSEELPRITESATCSQGEKKKESPRFLVRRRICGSASGGGGEGGAQEREEGRQTEGPEVDDLGPRSEKPN